MREVFLCKYGEIVLKGANRAAFESLLCRELKYRLSQVGKYRITRGQSVITVTPSGDRDPSAEESEAAYSTIMHTFGIIAVCRSAAAPKDFRAICDTAVSYLEGALGKAKTFKVETKRADKRFPMRSNEISAELGGVLLSAYHNLKVDVHNPDVTVRVDIRDEAAYISANLEHAAGGMPVGSNGKGLLLLSGGIDSPVAGWMMAKRGVKLDAVYFEAFPYTSIQAREKVITLAKEVARWSGSIWLHIVSLTEIEEDLARSCNEDYFTLLLRRYMMRIAEKLAADSGCGALITGESMGQVASQTMESLAVTDGVVGMPVFRPCIGMDKEEIISVARKIGTFDTSILPFEDCCTVFTPKHPKTRPTSEAVEAEEAKVDIEANIKAAIAAEEIIKINYKDSFDI
ncbi:MAG: tRNA 4-thiouridine(8) synthase ThiI [Clostridia bacterium]|nr:tRNA 4-thiouridine(8) synthase ThiI [Clostridia bacterium]